MEGEELGGGEGRESVTRVFCMEKENIKKKIYDLPLWTTLILSYLMYF